MSQRKPLIGNSKTSCSWRPLTIVQNWSLKGGYSRAAIPLDTMYIDTQVSGESTVRHELFIKVENKNPFLRCAALGKAGLPGDMRRVKILEHLRKAAEANDATAAQTTSGSVPEDDSQVTHDDDDADPMDSIQLDVAPASTTTHAKAKAKPKAKAKARARLADNITSVEVDVIPRAAAPSNTDKIIVRVVKWARGLYISENDVAWLVAYVADDAACGGVIMEDDINDRTMLQANTTVPDCRIHWDFQRKGWISQFVAGPHTDATFFSGPNSMTADKWAALAEQGLVEGMFWSAGDILKRKAAWHHLVVHCEKFVSGAPTV